MIEQRKNQRFELRLPVEVVRAGSALAAFHGETLNLSSAGALVCSGKAVDIGEPVEYFITLPATADSGEVRLRCMGTVVRRDGESNFAVTLERYEFVRAVKAAHNGAAV